MRAKGSRAAEHPPACSERPALCELTSARSARRKCVQCFVPFRRAVGAGSNATLSVIFVIRSLV